MNVLLVTFRLPGLDEPAYRRLAAGIAPRIAGMPGLLGKTWLADHASNTYGGLVLFENQKALDAYLASEIIRDLRANPRLTEFSATRFDTLADVGRMTKGFLPVELGQPAAIGPAGSPRRRLVWRTHAPSVQIAAPSDEATWEDAEWR